MSHDPAENKLSSAVLAKLVSLNEKHKQEGLPISFAVLFEYYNTKKVLEVSNDAMAFPSRSSRANAMSLIIWEKNDPELLEAARKGAAEIRQEVSKAQGETGVFYTNFGESSDFGIIARLTRRVP